MISSSHHSCILTSWPLIIDGHKRMSSLSISANNYLQNFIYTMMLTTQTIQGMLGRVWGDFQIHLDLRTLLRPLKNVKWWVQTFWLCQEVHRWLLQARLFLMTHSGHIFIQASPPSPHSCTRFLLIDVVDICYALEVPFP